MRNITRVQPYLYPGNIGIHASCGSMVPRYVPAFLALRRGTTTNDICENPVRQAKPGGSRKLQGVYHGNCSFTMKGSGRRVRATGASKPRRPTMRAVTQVNPNRSRYTLAGGQPSGYGEACNRQRKQRASAAAGPGSPVGRSVTESVPSARQAGPEGSQ